MTPPAPRERGPERRTQRGPERGLIDGVCRVLALRANGIGDFLVVIPALNAVRRAYPDAEITVVGDAWLPGLASGRPGPWSRCLVAPRYPGLRGLPTDTPPGPDVEDFLAARRAERYDLALQLHGGGATSNTFVSSVGARVTAGARANGAPPLDRSVPYLAHRHEVLRWLDVVGVVGAGRLGTVEELIPRIALTEHDLDEALHALPTDAPYVALHLGARDARRCWPLERFVALGRRVLDAGLTLVLVGGLEDQPDSARAAAELKQSLGNGLAVHDLAGRLSLSGTIGVLAGATAFVGNDSGPRHLAAAVGTPTVGIFWLSNVLSFGPLVGDTDRALVAQQLHCPVCGEEQVETRCEHDVSFVSAITVDQVEAALAEILAEPTEAPPPEHPPGGAAQPMAEPTHQPREQAPSPTARLATTLASPAAYDPSSSSRTVS